MELDAFDFVLAVAEAHDDAIVCLGGNRQFARERLALNDEGVIARGREGLGKFAEDALAVVMDFAGLAVKKLGGANDSSAEGSANRLMAETDT